MVAVEYARVRAYSPNERRRRLPATIAGDRQQIGSEEAVEINV
jgi:hypothetical protein